MIKAKCIDRKRNKENIIVMYTLQDEEGNVLDVKPCQLRVALRLNKIEVTNVILTSNSRLKMRNEK